MRRPSGATLPIVLQLTPDRRARCSGCKREIPLAVIGAMTTLVPRHFVGVSVRAMSGSVVMRSNFCTTLTGEKRSRNIRAGLAVAIALPVNNILGQIFFVHRRFRHSPRPHPIGAASPCAASGTVHRTRAFAADRARSSSDY